MKLTRRHGIIAFILALSVHLTLAAAWLLYPEPELEPMAEETGLVGVSLSLAAAGELLASLHAADAASSESQAQEAPEAVEPVMESVPEPLAEPVVTMPSPIPRPEPIPKPRPQPAPQAVKPTPAPAPSERQPRSHERADSGDKAAPQSQKAAGAGGSEAESTQQVTDHGGNPALQANYFAQLSRYLGQHKRYPMAARRQQREGTAEIEFTLDRQGRVLHSRLVRSSGHAMLDREVEAMLERAAPLPPFPADIRATELVITLPVSFNLRER